MKVYNVIQFKNGIAIVHSHATAAGASKKAQEIMDSRNMGEDIHIRIEETDLED